MASALISVSSGGEASAAPAPCKIGFEDVPIVADSSDMQAPASTLRLCRGYLSTHSLEVINDGPFVWMVSGVPPEEPDLKRDVWEPKAALFRQASKRQVPWLTVAPGRRVSFTSDSVAPDVILDYRLQAAWEMVSYTVDRVKVRTEQMISQTGPAGRAAVECGQAAYQAASQIYPNPVDVTNVSLEYVIETAGEFKQCKSAVDAAKDAAASKKLPPPIKNEDFLKTSLENKSFQRPANTFMEAVRRIGKFVKLK